MSSNIVTDILANRSSEEKKTLLMGLLRELMQQYPRQPITINDENGQPIGMFAPSANDENGQPIGMFAPSAITLQDDVFVEGTPTFFDELERRRQSKDLLSAEEALQQLRSRRTKKQGN